MDKGYPPFAGDRKVETAEELLEVLRESERGLPVNKMWISEAVESVGRRIWEEQQEALRRTAS